MDSFKIKDLPTENVLIIESLDLNSILISFLISVMVFYLVKYYWNRRRFYYSSWNMEGPPAWPLIGNAFYFSGGTEDILDNITNLGNTYKSPIRVWLGQRLFFGITKAEQLEIILNGTLHKEKLYEFAEAVVGKGIFTAPVDQWRKHRKVILPTFNPKILNTFVDIFSEQSKILVGNLKNHCGKECFDILPALSRCTLDIICETAMGKKVYAQTQESNFEKQIGRALEIVYMRMFQLWLHPDFIWKLSPLSTELDYIINEMRTFIQKIITEKKDDYRRTKTLQEDVFSQETPKRKAFLDYVIELSEEGANWTDEEILQEALTILVAGSDSTGSMDSFALVMLGMHPDIQKQVYDELYEIFGDSDRNVTSQDLPKMTYLERVIKETLRLFPVGPVIVRALHEDIKLENHTLSKGCSCVLSIFHAHRDPQEWPDPLKFDPDRFLPEEVAKRHPYSYIPFSAGPRNCIGPRYAMMAMKAVISTIVRTFKISTDVKRVEDIKLKADLMIKSIDGCRVSLESRNKHNI